MSPRETQLMIDVLASTIPDAIDLSDERAVTQHLCGVCAIADYRPTAIEKHISAIITRAQSARDERAAA